MNYILQSSQFLNFVQSVLMSLCDTLETCLLPLLSSLICKYFHTSEVVRGERWNFDETNISHWKYIFILRYLGNFQKRQIVCFKILNLYVDSETLEIDLFNEYNPLSAKPLWKQKVDLSRKEYLTITSDPFFKHHLLLSKESFSIQ